MQVLIVEDHAFNAFCLTNLLQLADRLIQVTLAEDSMTALHHLSHTTTDLIILDGHLGAGDGLFCNGPALADAIWQRDSSIPIIVWSDSDNMRLAFAEVFKQYQKRFNEHTCWTKIISLERIQQSLELILYARNFDLRLESPTAYYCID